MGFGAKPKPQAAPAPVAPAASLEAPTIDGPVTNASSAILQRNQMAKQEQGWQQLVIPLGSSPSMSTAVSSAGSGVSIPVAAAAPAAAPSAPSSTSLAIQRRRGRQAGEGGTNVEPNNGPNIDLGAALDSLF